MRKHSTKQPTLTTEELLRRTPTGGVCQTTVILHNDQAAMVTKVVPNDGGADVHLDRDLEEPLVLHVPLSSLAEPLWVDLEHRTCNARRHPEYWMGWGWLDHGGPFWCNGQH